MLKPGKADYYNSWDVFIHERGQFWPRPDLFAFGQRPGRSWRSAVVEHSSEQLRPRGISGTVPWLVKIFQKEK